MAVVVFRNEFRGQNAHFIVLKQGLLRQLKKICQFACCVVELRTFAHKVSPWFFNTIRCVIVMFIITFISQIVKLGGEKKQFLYARKLLTI